MQINQLLNILSELPYFTKQNLALAMGKEGEDLNYWIKKLSRDKLILSLKKGFYVSRPYQDKIKRNSEEYETYLMYLANQLRSPSYVSLEFILSKYNFIPEAVFQVTSVTIKSSRKYTSADNVFIYKSIKDELYFGYQLKLLSNTNINVQMADLPKALFDFMYFKKFSTNSELNNYLLVDGRFNWSVFTAQDKAKFIEIVLKSKSKKMQKIVNILKKGQIL